ncbi:ribonuclease III [Corynebacterium pseudodiphtheriticum]|uniref:ribonuclease III n=1 Tax=Corynebacterium pseudodiphtheriticum TaxID=37637 RepID=UPI002542713B|nr:ribonuclease III [Corynebacterium pseudodiphtheriticum]MDK4328041.1 ribonuclease III [Corynebacterium pseudodiphtheriticum]
MTRSNKKTRLTGEQALKQAFESTDHTPLLDSLGVDLSDEYLCLALTHRSFANENGALPNNERLEFLGDAVLGLSIAAKLYELHPDRPESDISKMRASIVSRYGLADVAREIKLGPHILLGKGEKLTDGGDKDSILADTTEALLGAIYRQYGFEIAREVILRLFATKIDGASARNRTLDWKTTLQEALAVAKLPMAVYSDERTGPDHDLTFYVTATVGKTEVGYGQGPNKKSAEQQAARQACELVQSNPGAIKV